VTDSIDTFLFDLDGTLIDSVELILASYRHTMVVHRGATPGDDVWLKGLGTPLWAQFREFTDDQAEIDGMIQTYRAYNLAHHDAMVRAYPGIPEALGVLAGRGVKLGLVTSKLRSGAFRGLKHVGLDAHFPVVVGSDDLAEHKPHPAPVLRALDLLDADPGRSVFIGDSPHDMAAGRAAGVRTAAALWGPFPRPLLEVQAPDFWLETPAAIPPLGASRTEAEWHRPATG
jgi:pyrophosphatase PpaX